MLNIKVEKNEFPRSFVPADADLGDWAQIEPLFEKLENENPQTVEDLEEWLLRTCELAACISQEGSLRHIAMTCQTDDKQIEADFMHFVQDIIPKCKPHFNALDRMYVAHPQSAALAEGKYFVYDRDTRRSVEMYREENIPLQVELSKLSQAYQKINGAMTVDFEGETRTLQQMGVYLEKEDCDLRQQAWTLIVERRMQDRDALEDIFDKMLELRGKVAANAGYDNYRDYKFDAMMRFDYTPADCEAFHAAVEKFIVPIARDIQERRKADMRLDTLRPWDLSVDPLGRPPLEPFEKSEDLALGVRHIFEKISKDVAGVFRRMIDGNLLDLDSRVGKAPGGYMATLQEWRLPFIFMNAVGLDRDVWTLLHEGGHAFHSFQTRGEEFMPYRSSPMEFAEVASMSMELLGMPYMEEFYEEDDAQRSSRRHLEGIIGLLPWIATVDAFQQWIYTNPGHTRQERRDKWVELMDRFGGIEDWSGFEEVRAYSWHRQLHIFEVPFYYIEYGIAQLGALQVWRRAQTDLAAAFDDYAAALALGQVAAAARTVRNRRDPFRFRRANHTTAGRGGHERVGHRKRRGNRLMSDKTYTTIEPAGLKRLSKGKVRDIFDLGEHLLFVASDRISAFDVVLPQGIPHKGAALTQISKFWFERIAEIVPNHTDRDRHRQDARRGPRRGRNAARAQHAGQKRAGSTRSSASCAAI